MKTTGDFHIRTKQFRDLTRYILPWSPYYKMDRFVINNHIPAEGGIYQVFYKHLNHLEELVTAQAYYGGLRGTLREMMDPLSPRTFPHKDRIIEGPCFCRFVISPSKEIQDRVLEYLQGTASKNSSFEVAEKDHNGLVLQF